MDLEMNKKRIDLLGVYIEEGASSLDLNEDFSVTTEDLGQLTEHIRGSQLKKLIIRFKTSDQEWEPFFEALKASKIRELELIRCCKSKEEYLHLMELVKDTKITTFLLDQEELAPFNLDELNKFISCLVDSQLKIFYFNLRLFNELNLVSLFNALPQTGITHLYIFAGEEPCLTPVTFASICHNLEFTQLTELCLCSMQLNIGSMKLIGLALKNSSLQKLALSNNNIDDNGVDILVEGLVHSKINYLNLSYNQIEGANILGFHLKDTRIKTLILSSNTLKQYGMFLMSLKSSCVVTLDVQRCGISTGHFQKLMNSLKFSKVTELNVADNKFKLNAETSNIFKDTNLERVNFSGNHVDQEALICLAGSIRDSKLNHIGLSNCFQYSDERIELCSFLLSEIRTSTVSSLDLTDNRLDEADVATIASHLERSKVTHLRLSGNRIGNGLRSLAKLTQISHLFLSGCNINDEGVEDLALILKNTQLVELDLMSNAITSVGARNLAPHLKDSCLLQLELRLNKIGNKGAEALAQGAEGTFITTLSAAARNDKCSLLDLVLWRNEIAKQSFLNLFKLISPKLGSNSFCFVHPDDICTNVFLENCLELCVTITKKPSAISVLLEDESIQLSKKEIISLISDEFPSQFVLFVASSVEADAEACVSLLKKAEDRQLRKVVEMFLLNRPLFTIDKNKGILHPYAYKLLHKYNYPICNLDVEPEGVEKILKYFIEHREIEGASDIIKLLC